VLGFFRKVSARLQVISASLKALSRKQMNDSIKNTDASDAALATRLARLWPNREHESSAVTGLFCRMGIHFWRKLDLTDLKLEKGVRFCFWCSKIRINKGVFTP
jgi:hypothetical protein